MIIKLAIVQIKKLPKHQAPALEKLELDDRVIHLSRPESFGNPHKLNPPVRIVT